MKSQLLESFDYESHYLFFFFSKVQNNFRGKKKYLKIRVFSA